MSRSDSSSFPLDAARVVKALVAGEFPAALSSSDRLSREEEVLREALNALAVDLGELHRFLESVARGQLELGAVYPSARNRLAGCAKELHSRLRELTWQAQQVASGDYTQRVHFLGDFSTAFNSMVETLERRERGLRESQDRLQGLFDSVADAVLVLDHATRIIDCNESVRDVLGYAKSELMGRDGHGLFEAPASIRHLLTPSEASCPAQKHLTGEAVVRRKDGGTFYSMVTSTWLDEGMAGQAVRLAVLRDITKLKQAEAVLREQATRDPLTGLFNRREALELADRAFHGARRHSQPLVIAMCDLDRFKQVNDTHGHQAGDHALRRFAAILREHMRMEDIAGRYGGDEFVVIFPGTTMEEALIPLRRVVDTLNREVLQSPVTGKTFTLAASFGLALLDARHAVSGELMEDADRALYAAKRRADSGGICCWNGREMAPDSVPAG